MNDAATHMRSSKPKADRRHGRRVCKIVFRAGVYNEKLAMHVVVVRSCTNACTHIGLKQGVAMMEGCEWHVRRWVKFGVRG